MKLKIGFVAIALGFTIVACSSNNVTNESKTNLPSNSPTTTVQASIIPTKTVEPTSTPDQKSAITNKIEKYIGEKQYQLALSQLDIYKRLVAEDDYYTNKLEELTKAIDDEKAMETAKAKEKQSAIDKIIKDGNVVITKDDVENFEVMSVKGLYENWNKRTFAPVLYKDVNGYYLYLQMGFFKKDWVFFENVLVSVDSVNRTFSFNSWDIKQQVRTGGVVEQVITEMSDSDIEWFKSIAKAKKVVVRFKGDFESYDITLSDKEKNAFSTIVSLYESLK